MSRLTPRQIIAEMHRDGASTADIQAAIKARMGIDVTAERIEAARAGKRLPIGDAPAEDDKEISVGVKQPLTSTADLTPQEVDALITAAGSAATDAALDSAMTKLKARRTSVPSVPASDAGSFLSTISDPPKDAGTTE